MRETATQSASELAQEARTGDADSGTSTDESVPTRVENEALVAIPAYNEAATIGSVVLGARRYSDSVVVVDDGSTDRTAEIARNAGASVVEQSKNEGKGAAVRRIFELARRENAGQLVLLDGDWQHDPREIPSLLEALNSADADMVIGSRYVDGDRGETPLYRRLGQKVLDVVTSLGGGVSVTDSQSGFRAFSREAIEQLDLKADGFGVEAEMLRSASENGLTVTEVPISVNYDVPNASTSNSVLHGVHVIDRLLEIVRDRHPLLFFGVPGLVLASVGLLYGGWTISIYQSGGGFYIGKALLAGVLFIVGTLAVFSALIMNMVGNALEDSS